MCSARCSPDGTGTRPPSAPSAPSSGVPGPRPWAVPVRPAPRRPAPLPLRTGTPGQPLSYFGDIQQAVRIGQLESALADTQRDPTAALTSALTETSRIAARKHQWIRTGLISSAPARSSSPPHCSSAEHTGPLNHRPRHLKEDHDPPTRVPTGTPRALRTAPVPADLPRADGTWLSIPRPRPNHPGTRTRPSNPSTRTRPSHRPTRPRPSRPRTRPRPRPSRRRTLRAFAEPPTYPNRSQQPSYPGSTEPPTYPSAGQPETAPGTTQPPQYPGGATQPKTNPGAPLATPVPGRHPPPDLPDRHPDLTPHLPRRHPEPDPAPRLPRRHPHPAPALPAGRRPAHPSAYAPPSYPRPSKPPHPHLSPTPGTPRRAPPPHLHRPGPRPHSRAPAPYRRHRRGQPPSLPPSTSSAASFVVSMFSLFFGDLAILVIIAWILSGALVFHRPTESALARPLLHLRYPTPQERAKLEPVWREVTARAGVEGRNYELWVEDSDGLNAVAAAGHIVGVTRFAMNELPNGELAAVMAHELGHHVGGHALVGAARLLVRAARPYRLALPARVLGVRLPRCPAPSPASASASSCSSSAVSPWRPSAPCTACPC